MAYHSYKLYYFNMRGRAEPARFLFHLAGVPYEDVRIEHADWPKHKEEMPWGQLPVLEVDGKKLAQSAAIYQFLAKQFGYNGKSDWETAQVQELLGSIDDIFSAMGPVFRTQDEAEKKKLMEKIVADTVIPYLTRLQKRFEANGTDYFVGNSLTVADLLFMVTFAAFKERFAPGVIEKFPKLDAFVAKVSQEPKIKEWIEKRPKTDM
uniref:glutathione transferase n=1 Tax=Plectus sambesii TaxID=2011161 RepID=A0A914VV21_9BILA